MNGPRTPMERASVISPQPTPRFNLVTDNITLSCFKMQLFCEIDWKFRKCTHSIFQYNVCGGKRDQTMKQACHFCYVHSAIPCVGFLQIQVSKQNRPFLTREKLKITFKENVCVFLYFLFYVQYYKNTVYNKTFVFLFDWVNKNFMDEFNV